MVLAFAAATWSYCGAAGQSTNNIVSRLGQSNGAYQSKVTVVEHGNVRESVNKSLSSKDIGRVYRIQIYSDNSQTAKEGAYGAKDRFNALYPNIPVFVSYNSPAFIVTVGNFLSREEAIMLFERIKGTFNRLVITTEENVSLKELTDTAAFVQQSIRED